MSQPIVVFGATGGIGGAIATRLARDGAELVLVGQNLEKLDALGERVGCRSRFLCDCTDREQVAQLFAGLAREHGGLAAVVFSIAKPFQNRLTHRTDWSTFEEQINTQLKGLHQVATHAFPLLARQGHTTRLLVVSSEMVLESPPIKTAPYSAAKAAMTAYSEIIAQEWLKHGVRVQILAPGMVETDLISDMPDAFLAAVAEQMPEKTLTSVSDVADMAAFCLSATADPLYGLPIRVSRGKR